MRAKTFVGAQVRDIRDALHSAKIVGMCQGWGEPRRAGSRWAITAMITCEDRDFHEYLADAWPGRVQMT